VFLYDVKHMDPERHRELTGVPNERILENLAALAEVHDDVRIRVPVVPGLNDDAENIGATARFAASLPGVRTLPLLPYHDLGTHKRERPGPVDPAAPLRIPRPDPAHLERLAELVADAGLEPHIGG
jgi:pyruvate formate lyase activating enzyme